MKPTVSVIVPVYNVEDYLAECLDSLLEQTFTDFEVICVNDGSTDGSLAILEAYAKKDARITFFSQENSGLSVARNHGIERASGKYQCLLDSDDYLIPTALEELTAAAEKDGLQLLSFNLGVFSNDKSLRKKTEKFINNYSRGNDITYPSLTSGPELLRIMVSEDRFMASACSTMLRRDFFLEHELWFRPGIIMEDFPYTMKAFLSSEKVGYLHRELYMRRIHRDSIITKPVVFARPYGYFRGVLDVLQFLDQGKALPLTEDQQEAVRTALNKRLAIARKQFGTLPSKEMAAARNMSLSDRYMFSVIVTDRLETCIKLKALHEALDEIVAEIYRICKKHNIRCHLYGGTLLGAVRNGKFIPWDDDVDLAMSWDDFKRFQEICKTELAPGYFCQTCESDPEYPRLLMKIRKDNTYFPEEKHLSKNMHQGIYVDILPLTYFPKGKIAGALAMNSMMLLHQVICFKRCHFPNLFAKVLYKILKKVPVRKLYKLRDKLASFIHKHSSRARIVSFDSHYMPYMKRVFDAAWFTGTVEMEFDGIKAEAPIGWENYLVHLFGKNYIEPLPKDKQKIHTDLDAVRL